VPGFAGFRYNGRVRILVAALLLVTACDDPGADPSADAGPAIDASVTPDAPGDASPFPLDGFGTITGACDELDLELTSPAPWAFVDYIEFAAEYTDADLGALTAGGQAIVAAGNAGGSSLMSEVFAFEVLARCELATLLKTETDIDYDTAGTITDLLLEIDGLKIGVSVTRAVAFPFDDPYTVAQAQALLENKLSGVLESTANVSAQDAWRKQILAVLAYGPQHAQALETALGQIDTAIRADTIVWITVTNGADAFIY
jgi:hypothetical protein